MSLAKIIWRYLVAKPLNTFLNVFLLSLGIAVIVILIILNTQLQRQITQTSRGVDLVIGAKGSPLQLILCNMFHIDFPTGNIKLYEADQLARHRLIRKAIPLALGDSYSGYRIVGTTSEYPALYEASLSEGEWWGLSMQVTIGANVAKANGMKIGDTFVSNHGLTSDGHAHDEQRFKVVGILEPSASVIDNLILTSIESVWAVHDAHAGDKGLSPDSIRSLLVPSAPKDSSREITAMLVQYRSAMGAIQLPRFVNSQTNMQAASPAFEAARLFSILGAGIDVINGFGYVLVLISCVSIFIALYNSLKERRYDLAIMRTMGATKSKLFGAVVIEGMMITLMGATAGIALGHIAVETLAYIVDDIERSGITGFAFYPAEVIILLISLLLGVVCSVIPALHVYRTDISKTLAST